MFRLALLLTCGVGVVIHAQPQKRLAGDASAVDIQDFPYQVSVYSYDKYRCAGAIISSEYVLTTFHCASFPSYGLNVRAGSAQVKVAGSVHKVAKIIQYDYYTSNLARFNDVALLKVEPSFEFDETRQPIPVTDAKVSVTEGDEGVVSGWGNGTD